MQQSFAALRQHFGASGQQSTAHPAQLVIFAEHVLKVGRFAGVSATRMDRYNCSLQVYAYPYVHRTGTPM